MDPRPYGFYMPTPTPFKQPSPELQQVFMREHYRMIHREIAQTQLKYFMPKVFIGFYGAILIFLSVVMIALEIASIVTKAAIYYVVGGIWGGLFGIFVAIFSLILSKSNAMLVVRGNIFNLYIYFYHSSQETDLQILHTGHCPQLSGNHRLLSSVRRAQRCRTRYLQSL